MLGIGEGQEKLFFKYHECQDPQTGHKFINR